MMEVAMFSGTAKKHVSYVTLSVSSINNPGI